MDTDNSNNSSEEAVGAQTASAEIDPGQEYDAAQQLQTSLSGFGQETQRRQEALVALIKQVSGQLRTTDTNVKKNGAQIDQLGNWIRYNRR